MIKLLNILKELSSSDHYILRKTERGKILDITNLKEIPLKDYKFSVVKEKLISIIETELKSRLSLIESKDIPNSKMYDIAYKVIKPVVIVDGKAYNIKMYAQYTKELKDKNGNVIGIELKDNYGIFYFAVIKDNNLVTLLLEDKEDKQDIIKKSEENSERKGEKGVTEVLTLEDFEYKIDLDELFGNKEKIDTKISEDTLDYKVRTDYRVGANFEHKQYGVGRIISADKGGKAGSNGKIDWIEVKYPKPFAVKSGKPVDTRRFVNILTAAYFGKTLK
jgi:hypothetical protein